MPPLPPGQSMNANTNNTAPTQANNYGLTGQSSTGITPSANSGYNYTSPMPNGTTTNNGYTSPNYGSFQTNQNQNAQNFSQNQQAQNSAFQGAYQSAVNALPTYTQLNAQNNAAYNVQPLMNTSTALNNQVLELPSMNNQLTQGSDTNQAQLDQMNNVQLARLDPLAAAATAQAQNAQTLSNQATGYGIQNEAFQTSPFTNTIPLQQTQEQTAGQIFSTDQANELAALTAAVQSGTTLTQTQMQTLEQLQQAQVAANATIQAAQIGGQATTQAAQIKANNQIIGQNQTYFDPTTGQYYSPNAPVATPVKPTGGTGTPIATNPIAGTPATSNIA